MYCSPLDLRKMRLRRFWWFVLLLTLFFAIGTLGKGKVSWNSWVMANFSEMPLIFTFRSSGKSSWQHLSNRRPLQIYCELSIPFNNWAMKRQNVAWEKFGCLNLKTLPFHYIKVFQSLIVYHKLWVVHKLLWQVCGLFWPWLMLCSL